MTALSAPKVLTVEDDPIVRADLRLILEEAGFDVCPDARDGVEAVDLARRHRPDLILIDLGLPRLDGVEATRRILGERDVPIVALTGHSREDFVERAVGAGAAGYVLKPFSEDQLVGALRDALAEREADQRHLLILVENMLRQGYSEPAIERAVLEAGGREPSPATASLPRRALRSLLAWSNR